TATTGRKRVFVIGLKKERKLWSEQARKFCCFCGEKPNPPGIDQNLIINMPIVTIQTNIEASKIPASIHKDLASLVAKHIQIPEKHIFVLVQPDLQLTRDGAKVPLVVAQVESVGRLTPKVNLALGSKLEEYFMENLGLPPSSCAIRFTRLQSQFTYSMGGLISPQYDYDEDLA
ncbi:hypothetical protein Btru_046670, partial [Bulinus truncatus]